MKYTYNTYMYTHTHTHINSFSLHSSIFSWLECRETGPTQYSEVSLVHVKAHLEKSGFFFTRLLHEQVYRKNRKMKFYTNKYDKG